MQIELVVGLLVVLISILSILIIMILICVTLFLFKLKRIAENADRTVSNIASATEWLSPAKVFAEVFKAFNKK